MRFLLFLTAAVSWSAPCTSPTSACIQWIQAPSGGSRLLVYSSYPLDSRNEQITRAFILLHGTLRDADDHFQTALAAAFLADALKDTLVIAPRFASSSGTTGNGLGSCHDTLAQDEADWGCEVQRPNSWRSGGSELGGKGLTSYDYMDQLLSLLSGKATFPNLQAIVLAGHSAGAQFVIRYQMSNRVHESLAVPISYLVANSSGYPYLDERRPTATAMPHDVAAAAPGYNSAPVMNPPPAFSSFGDARNCGTFDDWPYGLKKRVGYSSNVSDAEIKRQIVARPVTFLLGEYDILPLGGFDTSCPAMAQGPTRLARGLVFNRYLSEQFQARHSALVVPLCGHNARCMFTANIVLPVIFPKQ